MKVDVHRTQYATHEQALADYNKWQKIEAGLLNCFRIADIVTDETIEESIWDNDPSGLVNAITTCHSDAIDKNVLQPNEFYWQFVGQEYARKRVGIAELALVHFDR